MGRMGATKKQQEKMYEDEGFGSTGVSGPLGEGRYYEHERWPAYQWKDAAVFSENLLQSVKYFTGCICLN